MLGSVGIAKAGGAGGWPPWNPPGGGGWRAYTDMNHTTCSVEVGGQVWVGTSYAGLAVYDASTADLLAKYHGAKDALAAPETIVHLVDLPSDCILDIVTDNGIIWAATDKGLVRINPAGPTFKTYTRHNSGLSSDYVRRIMLGADQTEPERTYFMTDYGVCSSTYDYMGDVFNDDWEYFNSWQYPPNPDNCGFVSDNVFCIAFENCADGRIFFGTDCGALGFDPSMPEDDYMRWFCWDTLNSQIPSNIVVDIACVGCRELYFATGDGLAALEDGEWRLYNRANTAPLGLLDDAINRMIVDPNDDTVFWFATPRGVNTFDRTAETWTCYVAGETGLCNDDVRDIQFVSTAPYFATGYGACRMVGANWTTYLDPLAFRGCVSAIDYCLDDGRKFVGTLGGGLFALDDSNPATPAWTHYTVSDPSGLPSDYITAIDMVDEEQDFMFLGSDEGFAVGEYNGGWTFTVYNMSNTSGGLISNAVTCVEAYDEDLAFIGTEHGFAVYDNRFDAQGLRWTFGTVESTEGLLTDNWITDVAVAPDDTLWITTRWGVVSTDPTTENFQAYYTTNSGLISDIVFCVDLDPDGNPWFGTARGISTCSPDGTNWRSYRMNNSGLASDIVLSLRIDYAGKVWAGTDRGLSCLDSALGVAYNYYTDDSGLFSNYICSIDIDPYGNRWFGTQAGVSELINQYPSLYGGMVTPDSGDRVTEYVYSVHYSDPECEGPVELYLVIDCGAPIDMTLVSGDYCEGTWEYGTVGTLDPGAHTFVFYAVEADAIMRQDGPYPGPTVSEGPYNPDPFEPDNTCTGATLLPTDGSWHEGHNLEPPGDEDWFMFDAEYNITYVIDVEDDNDQRYDGNVYLYDLGDPCTGDLLREDLGGSTAHIVFPCLVTGRYYIKVESSSPVGVGSYRIRVYGPQWPMVQRDLERAAKAVGMGPATTNLKWMYTIPDDIITTPPVIDGHGSVFVGTSDNSLLAFDYDGLLMWSYHTADAITAGPALTYDERVFFGTEGGQLFALDSDGSLDWIYNGASGSPIHAGVTINRVQNYTIYFGADNGRLYAVNSNGTGKWTYGPLADEITGTIMIGELENVYFGGGCGTFHVLFPDGSLAWSYETGLLDNEMAAALATDGSIFFGTSTRRFCCVEPPAPGDMPGAGNLRWSVIMPESVYSIPVIGPDGDVFFGCDDGLLYAIGQHSTITTIIYDAGAPIRSALIMDSAGRIYFGADDGKYHCVTQFGTLLWETDVEEPPAFSGAIDNQGTLYWAKPDGRLIGYNDLAPPDFFPPASTCESPTFANAGTLPISVTFESHETGPRMTGIAYTELWHSLNGGAWTLSTSPKLGTSGEFSFMPTAEGVYDFATVAYDNVGNGELLAEAKTTTTYDATPPVSGCDTETYLRAEEDVEVSYTIDDDLSGPARTRLWCRFNDGLWRGTGYEKYEPSGVFTFNLPQNQDGTYYFYTQGADNAQNWEPTPTATSIPHTWLILDTVPPTSSCTAPLTAETAPIAIGYTAADDRSGVKFVSLYYTFNDDGSDLNDWRRYPATGVGASGSVAFVPRAQSPWNEGPGQYQFLSCAQDNCGNVEDLSHALAAGNIVTTTYMPGQPTSTCSCAPYANTVPVLVDYTAIDRSGMGISEVWLWLSRNGQPEQFTGQIQYGTVNGTFAYSGLTEDAVCVFRTEARDKAGGAQQDGLGLCTLVFDQTPGISACTGPLYSTGGDIAIEYTAWDGFSGVDLTTVFYRYSEGSWASPFLSGPGEFGVIQFTPVEGDGLYEFYSVLQDMAGNLEDPPDFPDFRLIYDTQKPTTQCQIVDEAGLPVASPARTGEPLVRVWYLAGLDLSGIVNVDLLYIAPNGGNPNNEEDWEFSGQSSSATEDTLTFSLQEGEGPYNLTTRAADRAGNLEDIASWVEVVYDASAPESDCSGPFTTTQAPLNIDFTAADAITEVHNVWLWYRFSPGIGYDPIDWIECPTPATVAQGTFEFDPHLGEGIYDFYTVADDTAGNAEAAPVEDSTPKTTVRYDMTAPESDTIVCVQDRDGNRNCAPLLFVTSTPIVVSFTASDLVSGLVDTTVYYRFNGGAWRVLGSAGPAESGEFVFDIDLGVGVYEFTSVSEDAAGNTESLGNVECTAWFDRFAPTSTCESAEYVSTATIVISYTATDDSDFVRSDLYFRKDRGPWADSGLDGPGTSGTIVFTPHGDGAYDFFTRARDMAGRSEIMKNEPECTTIYDTKAPSSMVSVPRYVTTATITNLTCQGIDNLSGIASVRIYSKFGLGEFTYTGLETNLSSASFTYTLSEGEGNYEFLSIAKDRCGNVQPTPSTVVPCVYDVTPPETQCFEVVVYYNMLVISFFVDDSLSGIAPDGLELWYSHDGGEWTHAVDASTDYPWSTKFRFVPPSPRGEYAFYTIGRDWAGNVEAAPDEADVTYSFAELKAFPSEIEFGEVTLGKSSVSTLQLLNVGDADLYVTGIVPVSESTVAAQFSTASHFPITIAAHDYREVYVKFAPTEPGLHTAVMKVLWLQAGKAVRYELDVPVRGRGEEPQAPTIVIESSVPTQRHPAELVVEVSLENPGPARSVEAFVAVAGPSGELWFWPMWTSEVSGLAIDLPEDFALSDYELLRMPLAGIPPGSYTFYAALVVPGTRFEFIGPLSVSPIVIEEGAAE